MKFATIPRGATLDTIGAITSVGSKTLAKSCVRTIRTTCKWFNFWHRIWDTIKICRRIVAWSIIFIVAPTLTCATGRDESAQQTDAQRTQEAGHAGRHPESSG